MSRLSFYFSNKLKPDNNKKIDILSYVFFSQNQVNNKHHLLKKKKNRVVNKMIKKILSSMNTYELFNNGKIGVQTTNLW